MSQPIPTPVLKALHSRGFDTLSGLVDHETLTALHEASKIYENASLRERKNAFDTTPSLRQTFEQLESRVKERIPGATMTDYCFYISKSKEQNWPLSMHQDKNLPEYLQLSEDSQVEWLHKGFWIRINLDDNDEQTGALRVIPGSHKNGIQSESPENGQALTISAKRGDIVVFSPLLFHGSNRMATSGQRRVFQCLFTHPENIVSA